MPLFCFTTIKATPNPVSRHHAKVVSGWSGNEIAAGLSDLNRYFLELPDSDFGTLRFCAETLISAEFAIYAECVCACVAVHLVTPGEYIKGWTPYTVFYPSILPNNDYPDEITPFGFDVVEFDNGFPRLEITPRIPRMSTPVQKIQPLPVIEPRFYDVEIAFGMSVGAPKKWLYRSAATSLDGGHDWHGHLFINQESDLMQSRFVQYYRFMRYIIPFLKDGGFDDGRVYVTDREFSYRPILNNIRFSVANNPKRRPANHLYKFHKQLILQRLLRLQHLRAGIDAGQDFEPLVYGFWGGFPAPLIENDPNPHSLFTGHWMLKNQLDFHRNNALAPDLRPLWDEWFSDNEEFTAIHRMEEHYDAGLLIYELQGKFSENVRWDFAEATDLLKILFPNTPISAALDAGKKIPHQYRDFVFSEVTNHLQRMEWASADFQIQNCAVVNTHAHALCFTEPKPDPPGWRGWPLGGPLKRAKEVLGKQSGANLRDAWSEHYAATFFDKKKKPVSDSARAHRSQSQIWEERPNVRADFIGLDVLDFIPRLPFREYILHEIGYHVENAPPSPPPPPPAKIAAQKRKWVWDNTIHPLSAEEEDAEAVAMLEASEESGKRVASTAITAITGFLATRVGVRVPVAVDVIVRTSTNLALNQINPNDDPEEGVLEEMGRLFPNQPVDYFYIPPEDRGPTT